MARPQSQSNVELAMCRYRKSLPGNQGEVTIGSGGILIAPSSRVLFLCTTSQVLATDEMQSDSVLTAEFHGGDRNLLRIDLDIALARKVRGRVLDCSPIESQQPALSFKAIPVQSLGNRGILSRIWSKISNKFTLKNIPPLLCCKQSEEILKSAISKRQLLCHVVYDRADDDFGSEPYFLVFADGSQNDFALLPCSDSSLCVKGSKDFSMELMRPKGGLILNQEESCVGLLAFTPDGQKLFPLFFPNHEEGAEATADKCDERSQSSFVGEEAVDPDGHVQSSTLGEEPINLNGRVNSSSVGEEPINPDGRVNSSSVGEEPINPDGQERAESIEESIDPDVRDESSSSDENLVNPDGCPQPNYLNEEPDGQGESREVNPDMHVQPDPVGPDGSFPSYSSDEEPIGHDSSDWSGPDRCTQSSSSDGERDDPDGEVKSGFSAGQDTLDNADTIGRDSIASERVPADRSADNPFVFPSEEGSRDSVKSFNENVHRVKGFLNNRSRPTEDSYHEDVRTPLVRSSIMETCDPAPDGKFNYPSRNRDDPYNSSSRHPASAGEIRVITGHGMEGGFPRSNSDGRPLPPRAPPKSRNVTPKYSLMSEIVSNVNAMDKLASYLDRSYNSDIKSWRHVAHEYKVDDDDMMRCQDLHSPSEKMFYCLNTRQPGLTIRQMKNHLKTMDRNDVIEVLDNYISILLVECTSPLGMEDNRIPDSAITASSEWDPNHGATNARLNKPSGGGRSGSWSAKVNQQGQYLQIDFGRITTVTKVATQGRQDYAQWVIKYKVSYSNDGLNFLYQPKVYCGNADQNTVVVKDLIKPIEARFVRIIPMEWHGHISMRVEFYGCYPPPDSSTLSDLCDNPSILGHICVKLDHGLYNWKNFAVKVGIPADISEQFKDSSSSNPAEAVLQKLWTSNPNLAISEINEVLTRLKREDVCRALNGLKENDTITALRDNLSIREKVIRLLNKEEKGGKTWEHFAFEFGIPREYRESLKTCTFQSPTKTVLVHIVQKDPTLTTKSFFRTLRKLERDDVVKALIKILIADSQ